MRHEDGDPCQQAQNRDDVDEVRKHILARRRDVEGDEEVDIRRAERDRLREDSELDELLIRKEKRRSPRERSLLPDHEDMITHHSHIDHGMSRVDLVHDPSTNRSVGFEETRPPRVNSPGNSSTQTNIEDVHISHR